MALARFATGQAGTLAQALVHENQRSGAAWTLEWMTLPPLAIATGAALRHADALLARPDLRRPPARLKGEFCLQPIVIAVAITGSVPRKCDNPAVPVTPAEQIESTHAAFEAGATLVHIHVRNLDESPSSDPDLFAQVQAGVRRHCPSMIVQFSTGGRGRDPAMRGLSLRHRPDMASLSTGSVNFPDHRL